MAGDDDNDKLAQKEKEKQQCDAREAERACFEQIAQENDALREQFQRLQSDSQGASGGSSRDDAMSVQDANHGPLSQQQLTGLLA